MIKGITIVRPAGTPEAYAKLASFFSALGFEGGRGWEEELSRGVSFLAPLGNLEFADGIAPIPGGDHGGGHRAGGRAGRGPRLDDPQLG